MIEMNTNKLAIVFIMLLAASSVNAQNNNDLELNFKREIFEDAKVEITTSQLINYQRDRDKALKESHEKIQIPCRVVINKPIDKRFNKETLGVNSKDESITTKHSVANWLQNALIGMNELGHHTLLGTEPTNNSDILVSTNLRRIYAWNYNLMYFGTISFEAKFEHPKLEKPVSNFYRVSGYHQGSYANAMNRAVNRLIERVSDDLVAMCKVPS